MDLNVPNWTCGKVQMNFNENRFNNLHGYWSMIMPVCILACFYRYPNKKTEFKLMQYNETHIFLNLGGA
jgi:hypothetical protein